ncbi:DEAD/DEAH box helicase [Paenibacillus filicis]|uniref:DEAD/DEAH box helicase n=1 Tax=Paenibacillus gyeongsangnamensis TaxID=3388067 RepID=A0ABT4Q5N8_9BACL|nr:DEAD/DEAH box helicase [Paenibacillus filicis]MCZ8512202.1 DEAD/DEAH box helicase [Paenibacillus filicis]
MSKRLTVQSIQLMCGRTAYEKGAAIQRSGKVSLGPIDPEASCGEAVVKDKGSYHVKVSRGYEGDVNAECTCPSLPSYDRFCKHIAAVLIAMLDRQQRVHSAIHSEPDLRERDPDDSEDSLITANDKELTSSLLGLFADKPNRPTRADTRFDSRTLLEVEFICRIVSRGRKTIFAIEAKAGPGRLYLISNLREFLDCLYRREACPFSRHFAYDPDLHGFTGRDDAVLRHLLELNRNEDTYHEATGYDAGRAGGGRSLLVPPSSWETLLPLLAEAPHVKLEHAARTYESLEISGEPLPLRFEFDRAEPGSYQMSVYGLDQLTVLPAYGAVLSENKVLKLPPDSSKRLFDLKLMLDASGKRQIGIAPGQMELFMEKVIPGLMKLGTVHIAGSVADRIVQTPLKAILYLDRVRDRLLAGLEFRYGAIHINPFEGRSPEERGQGPLLMRDGEKENRIMELMEQSSFTRTEGGYVLDDEDAEFEFLTQVVPQLEQLLDVYATSAVKSRIQGGLMPPKVTVNLSERTDWLECRFELEGIPETEIRKLLQSLEEKRKFHRLPNGALLPLDTAEFREIIRFLNEIGIRGADINHEGIRVPLVRALHLTESREQGHAVRLGKSFRKLLENLRHPDHLEFAVPDGLTSVLRDYQEYGFGWMKTLAHYRFGGILADDMGLGKTLQSIAFLLSVLPEIRSLKLPALIVSPASLVYNWRNELKKFAPEIRVLVADGGRTERSRLRRKAAETDVMIVSYPLLRTDVAWYSKQAFHTLILDEAQVFKNHGTQTAKAVKEVTALHRFALTGTPVENRLDELWSIFHAVFPELFPDRRAFGELPRETVARRIRPFLLRRLKTDVLRELPEKIESVQASEMLPEQKKLYLAYLAKLRKESLKHLDSDTFHKNRIKILAGLTRLRQLCCHPALFVEGYQGSSAKFEQLLEMIEECRSAGKRPLVFSQFTEMLGIIGRELGAQGVPYFYLDGDTPAPERVELCRRFNEGERDLFLLSLKAGGTGLNLTGADTVILYDLWWNPAVEQQAADRAHRIGQKNVVQVIRLVTQGTVEDKMVELQQRKKHLIDEVIRPGEEALSSLSEQEIREILMI